MSIENIICKIECKNEQGTGFFVSQNIIITVSHVIDDLTNDDIVRVSFNTKSIDDITVKVNDISIKNNPPVAALILNENVIEQPLNDILKSYNLVGQNVSINGFPASLFGNFASLKADVISQGDDDSKNTCDNNMVMSMIDKLPSLNGMSGGPIIHESNIVGVLNAQNADNREAINALGVSIGKIKDFMQQIGVNVGAYTLPDDQPINAEYGHVNLNSNIIDLLINNLDSQIKRFSMLRINGKVQEATSLLKKELQKLEGTIDNKQCAYYYMLGAVWLLSDKNEDHFNWYNKAKALYEDVDDRVYQSILCESDLEKFLNILKDVDNVDVLNRKIYYYLNKGQYDKCIDLFENTYSFELNMYTLNLMAICKFELQQYDKAIELIETAINKNEDVYFLYITKGLVCYWKVLGKLLSIPPQDYIMIAWENHFLFSNEDIKELELALECFEKAKNLNNTLETLKACFLVSCLLKNDVLYSYIEQIKSINDKDPLIMEYYIIHKEIIKDETIKWYSANINHLDGEELRVYILYLLDSGEDIRPTIAKYSYKMHENSVIELKVNYYLKNDNIKKAKRVVHASNIDTIEKNKLLISIDDYVERYNNDFIRRVKYLLNNEKNAFYWSILCKAYYKMNKPNALIQTAKVWSENGHDLRAQRYLVIGYYLKKQYNKVLKVIDMLEKRTTCSEEILWYKASSLANIGMCIEAYDIMNTIKEMNNKDVVLLYYQLSEMANEKNRGILALEDYLITHPNDIMVTQTLVEKVIDSDPDKAFELAKQLYINNFENDKVGLWAIKIAFDTNYDEFGSKWLQRISLRDNKNQLLRKVSIEDIQVELQRRSKRLEEINKEYLNSNLPLAVACEASHGSMALTIYTRFMTDENFRYPLLWAYGTKKNRLINSDVISLDYHSLLAIYGLNVLDEVISMFEEVFISIEVINAINIELQKLKNFQKSVIIKAKNCCDMVRKYGIQIINDETIKDEILIVPDNSINDFENGKKYIQLSTLIGYCNSIGLTRKKYDEQIFSKEKHKIVGNNIFVFDYGCIDELLKFERDFFSKIQIRICKATYQSLENTVKENKISESCCLWLEKLLKKVIEYNKIKKINYHPISDKKSDFPEVNSIIGSLELKEKRKIPWLCVDRYVFVTCYNRDYLIYDINDLMYSLRQQSSLENEKYIALCDLVWEKTIFTIVPDYGYLYELLKESYINNGSIVETKELKRIKEFLYSIMNSKSIVEDREKNDHEKYEKICYIDVVFDESLELIKMIWNSDENRDWKEICSRWVLFEFSYYLCDCDLKITDSIHIELMRTKQLALIWTSLQIYGENGKQYIQWLTPYLEMFWIITDVHNDLAENLAKLIVKVHQRNESFASYILLTLQERLNPLFFGDVLNYAPLREIYGKDYVEKKYTIHQNEEEQLVSITTMSMEMAIEAFKDDPEQWPIIIVSLSKSLDNRIEAFVNFPEKIFALGLETMINNSFEFFISLLNWVVPSKYMERVIDLKEKLLKIKRREI